MIHTLISNIALGIIVLFGERGTHWDYYKTDSDWWILNLLTRLN